MLIVVCGLPGTGKSTVARRIADRLDSEVIRTDVVRKELRAEPQYTPEERGAVYDELTARARAAIEDRGSVVLDGTFHRREYRDRVRELATETGTELTIVRVVCDEATVERRIRAREEDASEADFDVYLEHRDRFDPLPDPDVVIDNAGELDETYTQIDAHF